jgi:hypothetical protein
MGPLLAWVSTNQAPIARTIMGNQNAAPTLMPCAIAPIRIFAPTETTWTMKLKRLTARALDTPSTCPELAIKVGARGAIPRPATSHTSESTVWGEVGDDGPEEDPRGEEDGREDGSTEGKDVNLGPFG